MAVHIDHDNNSPRRHRLGASNDRKLLEPETPLSKAAVRTAKTSDSNLSASHRHPDTSKIKIRHEKRIMGALTHYNEKAITLERVQETVKKFNNGTIPESIHVNQIYYINMEKNYKRREIMEQWLRKQPIPYQRVPGLPGKPDVCVPDKTGEKAKGVLDYLEFWPQISISWTTMKHPISPLS